MADLSQISTDHQCKYIFDYNYTINCILHNFTHFVEFCLIRSPWICLDYLESAQISLDLLRSALIIIDQSKLE